MAGFQFLHMNKGEAVASYAKNCTVQRQIISYGKTILEQAVWESVQKILITNCSSMGIADLGCSSGPNTLMVVSEIVGIVYDTCREMRVPLPEMRVALNDLPANDFNEVLMSLPKFYEKMKKGKGIGADKCFVSAVAGSFYGRLFPTKSLHFVHSSSSLHWLSQAPSCVDKKSGKNLNKGKIYISKTSPEFVVKAYLTQFEKDMSLFLRSRASEMVPGGKMVLSFMGRRSPEAAAEVGSHQWELLSQALMAMAKDGIVEEEKIDSFNAPYYAPSPEEVKSVIEEEGSFVVDHLKTFEIGWDGGFVEKRDFEVLETSKALEVSKTIRAVVEPMLESQFGTEIMDDLFRRYGELLEDYFSKTLAMHINLVLSLTLKS